MGGFFSLIFDKKGTFYISYIFVINTSHVLLAFICYPESAAVSRITFESKLGMTSLMEIIKKASNVVLG